MSRDLPAGAIQFDRVAKEYRLGTKRAHLAAAVPFGPGLGRGERLRALHDVSFHIDPGEAFALIGANGAGKSTALKCLAGVTAPTSGRINKAGRVVSLIELGIGFHPDLSGADNARFAVAVAGLRGPTARRVIEEAIAFSEIERFIDTPVKRYSSGMYARLSFGIASALPAEILVVDEILAVGDLAFQRKCYSRLAELRRTHGSTLVFVSHNEWVLKETCQRGALLSAGIVLDIGPIHQLLNVYHRSAEATPERFMAGESQQIRIESVSVVPDERVVPLHSGLSLDVVVAVAPSADAPVLGVVLFDNDGRLVWGIYSDENGTELVAGRQIVRVEVEDIAVLPGPCRVQVFAFDRTSPVTEDLRRIDLVVDGEVSTQFENGLVHVPSRWSTKISSA